MATPAAVLSIIVEAETGKASAELKRFNRGLDDKAINVTVNLDQSSFARARREGASLGGVESVRLKADIDTSSFARVRAAQAVLTKESAKLSDVFSRSNLSIGQWTAILAAALPVIVDLAGALGALTASAAAAAVGLAALGVGLGAVATVGFGGILAIAAPAISSLKDLITAQDAAKKAQVTGAGSAARAAAASAQQIKAAHEQVATAVRGVTTAEQQLASAQRSVEIAQESLTQARLDATRQLQDMKRAAIEGGTSEKRARLSLQQAQQALMELRASGTASALDLKDAELGIVEARQNLRDVTIQSNRDQKDYNKAQKGGIDQMPGVVSAQQSLDDAIRGVNDAQQGVADAHREVAKALENLSVQQREANAAAGAGATSLAALALAQRKAGPAAVKFAQGLKHLSNRWKELTAAGKADFFGMLTDGLKRTQKFLPLFAKSANSSMKALREGFDVFLKKVTGPGFKTFIRTMTVTFAKSMQPIGVAFGNIGKVLERIAVAVAPDILRMVEGFKGMTRGWVDSTRNARSLRQTVHGLVNQANAWWKLLKAATELIIAVLVPGMGKGKRAVEAITQTLKGWTAWVKGHPAEMRDFFKQGLETTRQLWEVLSGFIGQLFQISQAMRPIARAFLGLTKALNSIKVGNVSALTVLLGAFVAGKAAKGIWSMVEAFQRLKTAAFGAAAAEQAALAPKVAAPAKVATGAQAGAAAAAFPFAGRGGVSVKRLSTQAAGAMPFAGMDKMAAQQAALAAPLAANTTKLAQFAKVAGGAAIAITALVGAFEALRTNFLGVRDVFTGFFDKVLRPMGDAFRDLVDALSAGHAAEIFGAMGDALKLLGPPLKFVVTNMTKLVGLLAIGAIAAPFILAMTAMAIPVWLAVKAITFLIKTIRRIGGAMKDAANFIRDKWGGLGHVLGAPFRLGWRIIRAVVGNITDKVGNAVGFIRDRWGNLKSILAFPFRTIANFVGDKIGYVVGRVKDAVGAIRDRWSDLRSILTAPFRAIRGVVRSVIGFIIDRIKDAIHAFDRLKDKIPSPGVSIHHVGPVPVPVPHGAEGGLVSAKRIGFARGGAVGSDTVPAMLTPGEFVVRKQAVEKVGTPHLAALNAGKSAEPVEVKLSLEAGATKALVDDTRKAAKETSKALATELGKGHKTAGASTKEFVKGEGKQFKVLRSDTESTTTKLKRDVIERFQDFRKGGLKATDSLKKGSGKDFQATSQDAIQRTQRLKQNVTDDFNKTRSNTLQATGKMKQGVGADYHNMAAAAGDGIQKLGAMTNRALKALGVKAINFGVGVAKGSKPKGKQRGGHIYDPSAPAVGDHIPAMLEKGEFVVNSRAAKKHRAALEQINFKDAPRFAKGGIVAAGHLAEKMGLVPSENPAFGGVNAQHAPGSYHYKGLAIDVSGGDMRAYFGAVAKRWFGHGLAELFFDPIGRYVKNDAWIQGAIGGHSDHVHVAITSAFAGAMAEKVKRVLLKGQDGPLKDMGQKALDKVRAAANRYIEKKSPEAMEGKVLHGSGDVEKVFAQVAKKMSTSKIATLALGEAGFAESGMKDLAYGDASSQGALQLLSSTAAGLGVSPHDEAAIASLFFQRGFYGKGGANKLADQGLPAHLVAQNVQGSATPSGSNYAAQERSARGWMKRFNLRKGGIVAPFVGAFKQGGEVAQTGLGLLHKGEKVIPQKMQSGGEAGPGGPGGRASSRDGQGKGDHGGSTTFGSLNAIKKKVAKAMSERGTLARLDEGIDVVQRIAESTRSPSGSELSKGERAELIQLQQKLLGTLKRTRDLSERGLRIIKLSMRSLDRRVKRMQKRLDGDVKKGSKAFDHIKHLHKLVNRERDKKHPDRKQIGRWLKEVKKTQDEAKPGEKRAKKMKEEVARLSGKSGRFKAAAPGLVEAQIELEGLTGRSGRILDAKLALQELKDAGKPQPLHLDQLLAFAEAMRYGAFKIPAFAEGGIHKGGLALVGEKGPEVVKMPPASVHPITATAAAPTINFDADIRVFLGNREITDIVDTRIKVKDRKTVGRYRAGQVRR